MKILVLGSGAREHALVLALLAEDAGHDIVAAPGNAGIAECAETVALDAADPDAVTDYTLRNDVELVVIGPEAPLVAGVADALRTRGVAVFGPGRAAAALEGSKSFAKRIMDEAGVPTGRAIQAGTAEEAAAALDELGAPHVVKADGLAAGKGVLVTDDRAAAEEHARHWLDRGEGGVLVEEHLAGPEVSLFFLSDGDTVLPLLPAQDSKRLGDCDTGPNTGGMGAYTPLPWLTTRAGGQDAFVREVTERIALPVVRRLDAEGTPFVGLLYCGLILTDDGVKVIEFNARFGDPETQAILPLLETPLSGLLFAAATGALEGVAPPRFSAEKAVTVVLASEGYPEAPVTGRVIEGAEAAGAVEGVHLAHAGTRRGENGELLSAGGRVLNVVARGRDFAEARARAYEAVGALRLEGAQFRTDIAAGVAE